MYTYNNAYEDVETLNRIIGNLSKVPRSELRKKLHNALLLVQEELEETQEALSKENYTEVLDGAVDLLIVTVGLLQILKANAFDTEGAIQETNQNNLSKFCTTEQQVRDTFDYYEKRGIICSLSFDDRSGLFAVKNKQTGKLLKKVGFVPNDLKAYVPEDILYLS